MKISHTFALSIQKKESLWQVAKISGLRENDSLPSSDIKNVISLDFSEKTLSFATERFGLTTQNSSAV